MLFISCDPGSDGLSVRQLLHPPDDGGDLTAGQGVVGLISALAAGEVSFHNTGRVQGLNGGIRGIREGLDAGEIGGVQLQGTCGDLGHLQTGDGSGEIHVAAGDDAFGAGLGQVSAEGVGIGGLLLG